ncbi:MAG TPA: prepilin peptidase [Verrucomicrobiae bacterium]|nr:prepilin peptidase [Verrucomicrobiae bacterium]
MTTWLRLYLDFVVFAFGAVIGSFLNVCVHRMPLDQSIVTPPSHCPHCNQHIQWADNIPLLSYLVLRGKCRYCGVRISPRYFLIELLTAVLFLLMWLKSTEWDHPLVHGVYFLKVPIYWMVMAGLIVATFIDFEHYIIPNGITLGGVVVGFLCSIAVPPLQHTEFHSIAALRSFLGIVAGCLTLYLIAEFGKLLFGRLRVPLAPGTTITIAESKLRLPDEEIEWPDLFFRDSDKIRFTAVNLKLGDRQFSNAKVIVRQDSVTVNGEGYPLATVGVIEAVTSEIVIPREAMGMGDVKLLAAIGAFLGWQATLFSLFLSSLVGSFVGLSLIVAGRRQLQGKIPYGPYIALGAVVWLFAERQLFATMAWYTESMSQVFRILLHKG